MAGDRERTETVIRDGALMLRSQVIRVEVAGGPGSGKVVDLPGPEARVGTGRDCELRIDDPTVSRHHLTLRVEAGGVRVIDGGSRNGTSVDGLRVLDAYARPDSTITLGKTTLRLRLLSDVIELPLSSRERFGGLWGASPGMRRLFAILEKVAPTDATVLVEAETGTGKELVAEAVHEESPRAGGPFVVFDCSAISAGLLESELFGHLRGAFTGAVTDRAGAFEAADGGTLFLDEIGELPLDLQPKLLRALESLEIKRVGANTRRRVDVRVVAATNRSLSAEVDAGRFREDLYYRLAVVRLTIPPLRERPEDIPLLVKHFAGGVPIADAVVRGFQAQAWPGNVRELRNAVARVLSLGSPDPGALATPAERAPILDRSVPLKVGRDRAADAYERAYLQAVLQETGGNVSRAAELAGVSRKFVQRAMIRYRLRDDGGDDL